VPERDIYTHYTIFAFTFLPFPFPYLVRCPHRWFMLRLVGSHTLHATTLHTRSVSAYSPTTWFVGFIPHFIYSTFQRLHTTPGHTHSLHLWTPSYTTFGHHDTRSPRTTLRLYIHGLPYTFPAFTTVPVCITRIPVPGRRCAFGYTTFGSSRTYVTHVSHYHIRTVYIHSHLHTTTGLHTIFTFTPHMPSGFGLHLPVPVCLHHAVLHTYWFTWFTHRLSRRCGCRLFTFHTTLPFRFTGRLPVVYHYRLITTVTPPGTSSHTVAVYATHVACCPFLAFTWFHVPRVTLRLYTTFFRRTTRSVAGYGHHVGYVWLRFDTGCLDSCVCHTCLWLPHVPCYGSPGCWFTPFPVLHVPHCVLVCRRLPPHGTHNPTHRFRGHSQFRHTPRTFHTGCHLYHTPRSHHHSPRLVRLQLPFRLRFRSPPTTAPCVLVVTSPFARVLWIYLRMVGFRFTGCPPRSLRWLLPSPRLFLHTVTQFSLDTHVALFYI